MRTFDDIADLMAGQYRNVLATLSGHFAIVLDQPDPTVFRARHRLRRDMSMASNTFVTGFMTQIKSFTVTIKEGALAEFSHVLSEPDLQLLNQHVEESLDDLWVAMNALMNRDNQTVERELRRFALKVDLLQSATGISRIGALIKTKLGAVDGIRHTQPDRLGRKRASDSYVRAMVRQHMLLTDIETRLFMIAKTGGDLAVVMRDEVPDEVFSITGNTAGFRTYDELRDEVFHPNSGATVKDFRE